MPEIPHKLIYAFLSQHTNHARKKKPLIVSKSKGDDLGYMYQKLEYGPGD